MKQVQPYQPFLLRILHGLTGLSLTAAILTAFWTYNTYDGRWGKIPIPSYPEIEGLHGTFGLYVLLVFPAFVLYSFHRGQRRLIQPDSLAKLTQIGKPVWWYTLNRFTNTFALLALTLALFSGKMMNETWLPKGELNHAWYYAHLISWIIMVITISLHLLLNARIGGASMLLSMLNWQFHAKDSPTLWITQISNWWSSIHWSSWSNRLKPLPARSTLLLLESFILTSLIAAWIIPLFK